MTSLTAAAIGTGIGCTIWTAIGIYFGALYPELIATWVGFVGCTAYFIAGGGKSGFKHAFISNYVGVGIGCAIIYMGSWSGNVFYNALVTGFFSFLIVYLARWDMLKFSTCTFMGGFSAFATGGNWRLLLLCLLLGHLLGAGCDLLGRGISNLSGTPEQG